MTSTGSHNYGYDANGNMIMVTAPGIGTVRALTWDDENRLTRTIEGGSATDYVYDDAGKRIIKKSALGEVLYVNENYSVRNGDVASYHIFAGNTRVATAMKAPGADESVYYYHGDHLGSSSVVTNGAGAFHEGLEYFPYGETWVHDAPTAPGSQSMPYRFTSKEQDEETGLYYFGARYYDARLSKWISTDPALNKYFDSFIGLGGIYNPNNLNTYGYSHNRPLIYRDIDGRYVAVDDATFAFGGLLCGILAQGISDMITGEYSDWEDYVGSAVGGAAGGWTLLYSGPFGAGLMGGAVANSVRQGLKYFTQNKSISPGSFIFETSIGGLLGKFPGSKIPGITTGRNSFNQVYHQMKTKLRYGMISSVRPRTAIKMFIGRGFDKGFFAGIIGLPVVNNYASSISDTSSFLRADYIKEQPSIRNDYYNGTHNNYIDFNPYIEFDNFTNDNNSGSNEFRFGIGTSW